MHRVIDRERAQTESITEPKCLARKRGREGAEGGTLGAGEVALQEPLPCRVRTNLCQPPEPQGRQRGTLRLCPAQMTQGKATGHVGPWRTGRPWCPTCAGYSVEGAPTSQQQSPHLHSQAFKSTRGKQDRQDQAEDLGTGNLGHVLVCTWP